MRTLWFSASIVFVLAGSFGCSRQEESHDGPPATASAASEASRVKRGEQLVKMGGCADCHTPIAMDAVTHQPFPQKGRAFSGHPEDAPRPKAQPSEGDQAVIGSTFTSFRVGFGVVYAANLTPDAETGLGAWTADDFVKSMRTGRHRGTGRVILPPMPWQNLAGQNEDDLVAMFSYFKTLPPVRNHVPTPEVAPEAMAAMEKAAEMAQKPSL